MSVNIIPSFPQFEPLDINHRKIFKEAFENIVPRNSEFSFGYLFAWRIPLRLELSLLEEKFLIIRGELNGEKFFFPPVGIFVGNNIPERYGPALRALAVTGLKIICADEKLAELAAHSQIDGARIVVSREREFSDYVYSSDDLSCLKGDRYQSKRNFVNRFMKKYNGAFRYHLLDNSPDGEKIIKLCLEFQNKWQNMKIMKSSAPSDEYRRSILDEDIATREMLLNFKCLELCGCALIVKDEVAAFSIGEKLNPETIVVHIEKADPSFAGSYQTMVKFSATSIKEMGYIYINKEEDLGIPNLRKTKLSYHPVRFVEKYEIKFV